MDRGTVTAAPKYRITSFEARNHGWARVVVLRADEHSASHHT
jgi:hypothetical protein